MRRIGSVPHVLAHARVEAGFLYTGELGPTVQYRPGNYAYLAQEERPVRQGAPPDGHCLGQAALLDEIRR
ncbi:NDP-hexose 2,3-dehydratase family protein [Streptomyces sp. CA-251387]|uniref:NDP-hexose 2,3-dehydratase family protein n=1 Tax=Streptomyces sp. CA-251387 TaxID=3240064 RepID=UPI003D90592C